MGPKYRRRCHAVVAIGLSAGLSVVACGESLDPSSTAGIGDRTPTLTIVLTGGFETRMSDAGASGSGAAVDELWVKIEDICLQGSRGRECLLDGPTDWVDVGAWMTLAEDVEVQPGAAQLRFIIAKAVLIAEGKVYATSAVDLTGDPPMPGLEADGILHCPSCSQSGIKVTFPGGEPTMTEGENFLVAEFDVAESIGKERGNSGRWVMHPVIRGSLALTARLAVTVTGGGKVTSSPAGVDCGEDCTENYPVDEQVQVDLTATADDGWLFVEWTGDCSGSEATTVVLMDKNKSCTATFEEVATEASMRGTVSVATNAQFPGSCGGLTVNADSLVKYFRPFISNGETRDATTDPITGSYEIAPLTPGIYNLGWLTPVPFGNEALAYFQVVVTDPDANPNDGVTEVFPGQTTIVDYSITEAFCSD